MNGRVLANAGVFALGTILIVGGVWGIWRGAGYIQLEWGWTSVISGTVAVTGGVLTLAIGCVLRRLDGLQDAVLRGALGVGVGHPAVAAPLEPVAEPMPLGVVSAASTAGEPSPSTSAGPALQAAEAISLDVLEREERRGVAERAEAPPRPELRHAEAAASQPPPEVFHAADQGPADDMVKTAGVSDEPELDAAIEELLAEERGRAPPQPEGLVGAASADIQEVPAAAQRSEPEEPLQRSRRWRGLFSRRERRFASTPPADGSAIEPSWERQDEQTTTESEPAAAPEQMPAQSPPVPADSIPRTGDDWFDRALSGVDEADEPADQSAKQTRSRDGARAEDGGGSSYEVQPSAVEAPPPAAPPPAEPAVIGRYTSGNTTYVMFADGSIEAETPSGILRFASLADLKVYVEGGQ